MTDHAKQVKEPHPQQAPTTLPRRSRTIRKLSADMAYRKLREENQRQSVSDRIGYAVAAVIGAVAYWYAGPVLVGACCVLYLLNAYRSYRAWKATQNDIMPTVSR